MRDLSIELEKLARIFRHFLVLIRDLSIEMEKLARIF